MKYQATGLRLRISILVRRSPYLVARLVFNSLPLPEEWRDALKRRIVEMLGTLLTGKKSISYVEWMHRYDALTRRDRKAIAQRIAGFQNLPRISVVMPVYNTPENWLRAAIESVLNQLYPHWELCIADDSSPAPHVKEILQQYSAEDDRIKVVYRERNGHIAEASNSALDLATGEYIALMDHDDELHEQALYMIAEELTHHPKADLLYSDEDKIDATGRRYEPAFKSDWNPDLLYSHNYVGHLTVYRTKLLRDIGGFRTEYPGSQDYDLLLRFIENTESERIRHIPHILYHWRAIPGSVALAGAEKGYAHENGRKALRAHFKRRGNSVKVEEAIPNYSHRVIFPLPKRVPKVSLIIPTRDRAELLKQCVDGILHHTRYDNLELLIMDNQSTEAETLRYFAEVELDARVRVVPYDEPFNFSAINNEGVRHSTGEIIGFINNDIKVIHEDWLRELVSHAIRPEIGIAGAKLYYVSDTIQHAGVVADKNGIRHLHKHLPRTHPGYCGRAMHLQNFSVVTGASMLLRREVFDQAGGWDENLPLNFNDVELCIRVRELGFRVLFTPYAELYHLESESRGYQDTREKLDRMKNDAHYLDQRLGKAYAHDPYYNPNLTLAREDASLASPPRVRRPWRRV